MRRVGPRIRPPSGSFARQAHAQLRSLARSAPHREASSQEGDAILDASKPEMPPLDGHRPFESQNPLGIEPSSIIRDGELQERVRST